MKERTVSVSKQLRQQLRKEFKRRQRMLKSGVDWKDDRELSRIVVKYQELRKELREESVAS